MSGPQGKHLLRVVVNLCLFVAGIALAVAPALAGDIEDGKWLEIETQNFRIRSLQSEKDTVELARYLEMFRVAAAVITNVSRIDAPIPTDIFAVKGRSNFRKLGIDPDAAGIFASGLRRNTIVIRRVRGDHENSIMMHEYAHFMVRNHSEHKYPRWFDEGFAEYLSGVSTDSDEFKIGMFPEHRRSSLVYSTWIPMRKIISPQGYEDWGLEKTAMFYAESWALVHYLLNHPREDSSFGQDMAHFLQLIESGADDIEAFEAAFHVTAQHVDRQVKRYLEKGVYPIYKLKINEILPNFDPQVTKLTEQQVSLALGQFALRNTEYAEAERLFRIAVTDSATRPQAEAGLGDVHKFRGEFEAAEKRFNLAVELAPEDPYCHIDLAEFWHRRASLADNRDTQMRFLEKARKHYLRAWKLDNTIPEVYAMYGQTFVLQGGRFEKALEMLEEAAAMLPSNIDIRVMLAQAYFGSGQEAQAGSMARSVLAWTHSESEAALAAREILSMLTTIEPGMPVANSEEP